MDTAALVCAAFLLNYQGELPEYVWHDSPVAPLECQSALRQVGLDSHLTCYAVTFWVPAETPYAVVIGSHDKTFRVWVVESIRSINNARGVKMPTREVYDLAGRWEECH